MYQCTNAGVQRVKHTQKLINLSSGDLEGEVDEEKREV